MKNNRTPARRRRSGVALVYVAIVVFAMMALCSLAVDLGRYEYAHASMYNAATAAARAGAAAMGKSGATSTSVNAAVNAVATANSVDGQPITTAMVTIQYISWTNKTTWSIISAANFSQANAVRVYISYTVPLTFGQAIGISSKAAVEHSTAEVITQVATPFVYGTGDVWLAGEPNGTHASQADPNYNGLHVVEDHQYPYDIAGPAGTNTNGAAATASTYGTYQAYSSPVQIGFTVTPGATITITSTSGSSSYDHDTSPYIDPTGNSGSTWVHDNSAANGVAEHGIADATMPLGAMNAVFLGSSLPDSIATPPAPLDFSTQTERDYVGLQPKLQQPFYVGTGQTSGASPKQQEVVVPLNATRMFMGVMDAWEWDNNIGGFNATVTETYVMTVE